MNVVKDRKKVAGCLRLVTGSLKQGWHRLERCHPLLKNHQSLNRQ